MAYNGYLIKLKGGNGAEVIPMKFMKLASYKCTPDQRMESKATRATTGILRRTTVEHKATKIEFETTYITNKDITALNAMLASHFTDALQRRLTIEYYDMETDNYREADCYIPDVDYTIDHVDNVKNIIYYSPVRFAFIEY